MKQFLTILCIITCAAHALEPIRMSDPTDLPPARQPTDFRATPAIAFGNNIYLVVWREGWHGKGGNARICAARFSADGKPLDTTAIEIAPASAGVQEHPRVAFANGAFLVVWQDLRNGKDYDILAIRLSPDLKPLDPAPLSIATGTGNQVLPDLAANGKSFLVVWQGIQPPETDFHGYAAAISTDGKVSKTIETGLSPQPRVAFNGTTYMAAAGGGSTVFSGNVFVAPLAEDGTPQAKPTLALRGTKAALFSLAPAADNGFLVISHRSPPDPWGWGGPGAMRAALLDAKGQPQNPDAIKEPAGVQTRQPGWLDIGKEKKDNATWPWGQSAATFDGQHTLVAWPRHHLAGEKKTTFENSDLVVARVDGYKSLDPEGTPLADTKHDESSPALASDNQGHVLAAWELHDSEEKTTIKTRLLTTR